MTVILEVLSLFVISVDLVVTTETCGAVQADEVESSAGWMKFTHKQPWLVKIFASYMNSLPDYCKIVSVLDLLLAERRIKLTQFFSAVISMKEEVGWYGSKDTVVLFLQHLVKYCEGE